MELKIDMLAQLDVLKDGDVANFLHVIGNRVTRSVAKRSAENALRLRCVDDKPHLLRAYVDDVSVLVQLREADQLVSRSRAGARITNQIAGICGINTYRSCWSIEVANEGASRVNTSKAADITKVIVVAVRR